MAENAEGAVEGGRALERAVTLARLAPYAVVAGVVAGALAVVAAVVLLDVSLSQTQQRSLPMLGFGLALSLLGLALLYQAAFVLRYPEVAIEHDVHPPSKYDLSFETVTGAKRTAGLTVVAGLFSLMLGAVGFWALIASQ